ncbi:MAG: hypothetical protein SGPRY_013962, partial [Prymnesium sp.]
MVQYREDNANEEGAWPRWIEASGTARRSTYRQQLFPAQPSMLQRKAAAIENVPACQRSDESEADGARGEERGGRGRLLRLVISQPGEAVLAASLERAREAAGEGLHRVSGFNMLRYRVR